MAVFDVSLTGLDAAGALLSATAHNVANMNTDGFKRQRVDFAEQPESGGVVYEVNTDETPGVMIPDGEGGLVEASNVDPAEEMVNLSLARHTYAANLKTVQAQDEMIGTLLDTLG